MWKSHAADLRSYCRMTDHQTYTVRELDVNPVTTVHTSNSPKAGEKLPNRNTFSDRGASHSSGHQKD